MTDIFVSYAAEDRDRVEPLVIALKNQGWSVWWDRELVAGPSFEERIEQALEAARCVVIAWSEHSVNSRWCRAEATEGLERGVLVPILLDDVRPPLVFRSAQSASLLEWPGKPGELNAALAGIRERLGQEPEPTTSTQKPETNARTKLLNPTLTAFILFLVAAAFITWWPKTELIEETVSVPAPNAAPTVETVAILPLRDLSADSSISYIAEGLTIELGQQIAAWSQFNVLPNALVRGRSVQDLRSEVDLLVDGHVSIRDDGVTVALDIVRMSNNSTLWSGELSAPLAEPYRLQEQIAANVALVFNEAVPPSKGPGNPAAYEAYLKMLEVGPNLGDIELNKYYLEQVLDLDPLWAEGWVRLGFSYQNLFWFFGDEKYLAPYGQSLQKVQETGGPEMGMFANMNYATFTQGKFIETEPFYRAIVNVFPIFYARIMLLSGLHAEAERALNRIVERTPYDSIAWETLAQARVHTGDFGGAVKAANQAVILNPRQSTGPLTTHGLVASSAGDHEKAMADLVTLSNLLSNTKPDSLNRRIATFQYHYLAFFVHYNSGQLTQARESVQWFADNDQHARAAIRFFVLGDLDAARAELSYAKNQAPFVLLSWFHSTAMLNEEQRNHSFILELQAQLGFTPEWRLEMCKRAAQMPPETGIACDPSKHALLKAE